jgi:biopolymer transport protein ExbD
MKEISSLHKKRRKVIMKKFIQICSLFSLLFVFSATAAFAQGGTGSEVNIPFAFNIGDRAFDAGNYIVKVDHRSGSAILSIQNTETDEMQSMIVKIGAQSTSGNVNLIFDNVNGQHYLSRINTPDRTYALLKSKAEKEAIKAQRLVKPAETAAVAGASSLY